MEDELYIPDSIAVIPGVEGFSLDVYASDAGLAVTREAAQLPIDRFSSLTG